MKRGSSLRLRRPKPIGRSSVPTSVVAIALAPRLVENGPRMVGGPPNGLHNVRVAGTAADLAGDGLADVLVGRVRIALKQRLAGEHHARGAEAALEPVLLHEALLYGVELAVLLESLDRGDLVPA